MTSPALRIHPDFCVHTLFPACLSRKVDHVTQNSNPCCGLWVSQFHCSLLFTGCAQQTAGFPDVRVLRFLYLYCVAPTVHSAWFLFLIISTAAFAFLGFWNEVLALALRGCLLHSPSPLGNFVPPQCSPLPQHLTRGVIIVSLVVRRLPRTTPE